MKHAKKFNILDTHVGKYSCRKIPNGQIGLPDVQAYLDALLEDEDSTGDGWVKQTA